MQQLRNRLSDFAIVIMLFIMPLALFWGQTVGGETLLPAENLYQFAPLNVERPDAPKPHNPLVSDSVLQNMQWKSFIRASIAQREVPLWNPHQFAGIPFMAAGQQSTLYPLSILYYTLPLESAYGWFVVINLWLAGLMTVAFIHYGLGVTRPGAVVGALVYQLCGFFVAGAVFPMMLAGGVWLPLLLLATEMIIQRRAAIPWLVTGAVALALNILAGHVEITYYTILITAYYGVFRLLWDAVSLQRAAASGRASFHSPAPLRVRVRWAIRAIAPRLGVLVAMGVSGLALGGVQFIPLFELVNTNWRADGADFATTLSYAHPARDVLQFIMPNFYGSPAQHTYFDIFAWENLMVMFDNSMVRSTEWGIKNYVEGALYVGLLPLALALFTTFNWVGSLRAPRSTVQRESTRQGVYIGLFAGLALLSLTFMFGLPTYALIYYGLPGLDQSHTPFRWVYAFTLCVAVLASFGLDDMMRLTSFKLKRAFAVALLAAGGGTLVGLLATRFLFPVCEPLFEYLRNSLALANLAFPDARTFYSHLFINGLSFSLISMLSGTSFALMAYGVHRRKRVSRMQLYVDVLNGKRSRLVMLRPGFMQWVVTLSTLFVGADLMMASQGFNPSSDPALLEHTPEVVAWLQAQERQFRITTLDDPDQPPLLPANMTMRYGLDDVRGYESIIPRQYVDYMRGLAPQTQLDFNRIAPIFTSYPQGIDFDFRDALTSDRLHLLNVRYVLSHPTTDISDVEGYTLAREFDGVTVWENTNALPRAYTVPVELCYVGELGYDAAVVPAFFAEAEIIEDTGREMLIQGFIAQDSHLIVSQTHFPGWRAYLQRRHADGTMTEEPLEVFRIQGNFTGVALPEIVNFRVRLVYSPLSFQVGAFTSALSGLLMAFLLGVWAWRKFVIARDTEGRALLARNSIAPVLLNLFNRGIDFVLAFAVLRVLGPEGTGIYYYAIIVFIWFDIFTNFGLDVYLMREVARDRSLAGRTLVNTTAFRLFLSIVGMGLLALFLLGRQTLIADPFSTTGVIALCLLYVGLLPGSLSKGLTSLYYAHERAEYPAAVATVTTISKAVLNIGALLLGFGIIGLAASSIINNFVTLGILLYGARAMIGRPKLQPETAAIGGMARQSWPLMLNHFLATIFFQIDVVIIEAIHGARMVGQYSVAYRWLLALNVIPAFFTQAFLPMMSRQANEDRDALRRDVTLALKGLAALSFPLAVGFTFLAHPLTWLLGGQEFLPDGAIALQLMIWSIPIGWLNSLTQYLLIALDKQRMITRAFAVGVTFNIATNLLLVPTYGYRAAALTTIASEAVLFIGFAWLLRGSLGGLNWPGIVWRPATASGVMAVLMAALWTSLPVVAVVGGSAIYLGVLLALRPLSATETARLAPMLPGRIRRAVLVTA